MERTLLRESSEKAGSHQKGGIVAVEVATNGADFTSSSGKTYAYVALPTVSSIRPPRGPIKGPHGSPCTGTGFLRSSALTCRFGGVHDGGEVTAATWFNDTCIICIAPPLPRGALTRAHRKRRFGARRGERTFSVSNHGLGGRELFFIGDEFVYDALLTIEEAYPPSGPASGNFSVVVRVSPLPDESELLGADLGRASSTLQD